MNYKKKEMIEYIDILNKAARAYYNEGIEIMSNHEYDLLYNKLEDLEKEAEIVLAGSPTQKVGYDVTTKLPKEDHESPMLSLDKTKDREDIRSWLGDNKGVLSWKLDGLTVVLTYKNGILEKAVTRGNGITGEVITSNARTFMNLPLRIQYKGTLVVRGEAVISYPNFKAINEEIPELDSKYKNPRNLCSGSVRQLDSKITSNRKVEFFAFSIVEASEPNVNFENSFSNQLKWLKNEGFDVVENVIVDKGNLVDSINNFEKNISDNVLPSDGLVLVLDDLNYSKSLGATVKFPRYAIAFKWQDEIGRTKLIDIIWSPSRTGLINPVAVFEPVELEGTTVTRASVHNVSILEELKLGLGDEIEVFKANMIIPQISRDITASGTASIPSNCPVCNEDTILKNDDGIKTLYCPNPKCAAKQLKSFVLFVSRDAMNIEGLSEKTLEKFIEEGFIKEYADIYTLDEYKEKLVNMEGFGEKSYINLQESIENSRKTTKERLLYSLGIPGIGSAMAKSIVREIKGNWSKLEELTIDELVNIDGIGSVLAEAYVNYFSNSDNIMKLHKLLEYVHVEELEEEFGSLFSGKVFVITGKVNHFKSRKEIANIIEKNGGKVASSVSSNTSYLINNDVNSASSKNKKAKELGVAIIDEDTLLSWLERS